MIPKRVLLLPLVLCLAACQWGALTINVGFDQASGLVPENRVVCEGRTAGVVEAVDDQPEGGVLARVKIDKKFTHTATEFARFYIIDDPEQEGRKAIDIRVSQPGGQVLADGATVTGVSESQAWLDRLRHDLAEGVKIFKNRLDELQRDLRGVPESDDYKRLSKSLRELGDELGRSEKEARSKLKQEWLPRLEQELDRLKRQLGEGRREQELRDMEDQVERIRRI